ncbi:Endodeoxyribonuclease RusA [Caballeronia temeraria]|uniref:Endodeoxyribonuclease RusA n=1 Tax=Caballeronia temeraria TaxID=1777137 RepID=A0A158AED9_9BURK|nr:RusA family crossover junction endodeoxyribonuclease [Caballeronia temeraria]SAK56201.1 Endodeoxyribonuclease RusA [Caballeronia temeraria]
MLPFEFTIKGPPLSAQTHNRVRLREWKDQVRRAAAARVPGGMQPVKAPVKITVTYYYSGKTPDVDNIGKPIQDALNGLVFVDDSQCHETKSRKRALDGSYQIMGASAPLLIAFSEGVEFLHIRVEECPHDGVLDK